MIGNLTEGIELVERHIVVLNHVVAQEPIGIVLLSAETGYPSHKIRASLRTLEENGLIEPTSSGAVTTEKTGEFFSTVDSQLDGHIHRFEELKIHSKISIN